MSDWAADKRPVWKRICAKYGGSEAAFDCGTWGFFDWSVGKAWPTTSSISKARRFGWNRYDDTYETWCETFRTFANAGMLPKQRDVLGAGSGALPQVVQGKAVNGVSGKMNGGGHQDESPEAQHEVVSL